MFGLASNTPDLRRILTGYGARGNPLLKDFPVVGWWDFYYVRALRGIARRVVSFAQAYRK